MQQWTGTFYAIHLEKRRFWQKLPRLHNAGAQPCPWVNRDAQLLKFKLNLQNLTH